MGSRKTMVDSHWTSHFNNHPRLNNMDVQVKLQKIKDNNSGPWNPKNNVLASHILCSAKDEKRDDKQMCSLYNKLRKASRSANNLPEGCTFRYVPLQQTNQIAPTPRRKAQLQKAQHCQRHALERHHPITVWGVENIYLPLTALNDAVFTICQVIMAIKSIENLSSPLFLGVDQQDDGTVIVTCDKSLREEAETLLSHLGIYLEVVFGSVIWDAFTDPYRINMNEFQYCPTRKCAIERVGPSDASNNSTLDSHNSATSIDQCFAKWGLHNDYDVPPEIEFDLTNQVSLHIGADLCGILGDIKGDSGTIRTDCSDATAATSHSHLPKPINYLIKTIPINTDPTNVEMQEDDDTIIETTSPVEATNPDDRLMESGND